MRVASGASWPSVAEPKRQAPSLARCAAPDGTSTDGCVSSDPWAWTRRGSGGDASWMTGNGVDGGWDVGADVADEEGDGAGRRGDDDVGEAQGGQGRRSGAAVGAAAVDSEAALSRRSDGGTRRGSVVALDAQRFGSTAGRFAAWCFSGRRGPSAKLSGAVVVVDDARAPRRDETRSRL